MADEKHRLRRAGASFVETRFTLPSFLCRCREIFMCPSAVAGARVAVLTSPQVEFQIFRMLYPS